MRTDISHYRPKAGFQLSSIFALALLSACVSSYGRLEKDVPPQGEVPAADSVDSRYEVRPGDELEVKLPATPENNERGIVLPDGTMSLPLIGPTKVAGYSVGDLETHLTDVYALVGRLKSPSVRIFVRGLAVTRIYVAGEVPAPGGQEYTGSVTALQAIVRAQGFRDTARAKSVLILHRQLDGGVSWKVLDFEKILSGKNFQGDTMLASNDVIYVPRDDIGDVQVWITNYFQKLLPLSPGLQLPIQ